MWGSAAVAAFVGVVFAALLLLREGGPDAGAGAARAAVRIGPGAVRVGEPFPAFAVTDVDGRVVTSDSLRGAPAILWFTTSYCVPCQVGAREVAALDDRLGGDAFRVVVLFVDPAEGPAALTGWRERFGRPDWTVALDRDGAFARAVDLRALDTKLLLDARGVLRDVDVYPVDAAYLDLLRRTVRGAS
jgi:thiol-disulfide isomerase/thioredoxin